MSSLAEPVFMGYEILIFLVRYGPATDFNRIDFSFNGVSGNKHRWE